MNWMGSQKGEGIEYHLLVLGIALAILVKGSGSLSVDRSMSDKSGYYLR
jgi:putative oxidoreductase